MQHTGEHSKPGSKGMDIPFSKLQNFTFGVEIEFILAFEYPYDDERYQYEDEIEDEMHNVHIRKPLELAGLQVHINDVDVTDDPELRYSKWTVKTDDTVKATQEDFDRINGTFANGVKKTDFKDFEYVSCEVISPILRYSAQAMREVQTAVETICKQSVFAPRSAGLHVHIGNGNHDLPLTFLKNLAILTTCFEQQWNQATPSHRLNNPHCQLPRTSFMPERCSRKMMAETIYGMPDRETLFQMLHVPPDKLKLGDPYYQTWHRNKAINYSNLAQWAEGYCKKTIEFRQQAGTVDSFEVLRWIVTVGAMAGIANEYPPQVFRDVIQRHYRANGKEDWTFSLLELFGDFDVEWLTRFWEGQLYVHEEYSPNQKQTSMATSSSQAISGSRPWPKYLVVLDE